MKQEIAKLVNIYLLVKVLDQLVNYLEIRFSVIIFHFLHNIFTLDGNLRYPQAQPRSQVAQFIPRLFVESRKPVAVEI